MARYGDTWNIWTSAHGRYACATRRANSRTDGGAAPERAAPESTRQLCPTLVEDSVPELAAALAREAGFEQTTPVRPDAVRPDAVRPDAVRPR